jgi:hypothetical protein
MARKGTNGKEPLTAEATPQEPEVKREDPPQNPELTAMSTADLKARWVELDARSAELTKAIADKRAVEDVLGRRAIEAAAGKKGIVIEIGGRQMQPKRLEERGGGRVALVDVQQRNLLDF